MVRGYQPTAPPTGLPEIKFFEWLNNLERQFVFDIGRYLRNKYFDILGGDYPPRIPQMDPQNHFFERLKLGR